jgi:hypothetical protein
MKEFIWNPVSMLGIDVRNSCQPTLCVGERSIEEFLSIVAEFAGVFRDRLGPVMP